MLLEEDTRSNSLTFLGTYDDFRDKLLSADGGLRVYSRNNEEIAARCSLAAASFTGMSKRSVHGCIHSGAAREHLAAISGANTTTTTTPQIL
ncbi:MAG: hypothetical protein IIA75_11130 [Proteobacteria bacterium]|nr:hypothetical protein [Pseudomonadota bacterium]